MAKKQETALAGYEDWKPEDVAEEAAEAAAARTAGKYMGKFSEGRTVLRILPAKPGKKSPFRVVYRHFVDVPGVANAVKFVCPRMEAKLPCRVCAKARQMQASSNPVDQKRGQRLMPQRRVMANAINRAGDGSVQIVEVGKTVHEALLELRDPSKGLGINFVHPTRGVDIFVLRKGTGQNDTEYKALPDPQGASPIADSNEEIEEKLAQMHDLDAECDPPTDEDIQKLLNGEKLEKKNRGGNSEFADPTGRSALPPTRSKPTAQARVAAQAVEEEEFDEDGFPIEK